MNVRVLACLLLVAASACGGAARAQPSAPPAAGPAASAPAGPIVFDPEQLIFPPEDLPLPGAEVARDAPIAAHGWERQFALPRSPDFRWFNVRLFVNEPDVTASAFVAAHDCDTITWPTDRPAVKELVAPSGGDPAVACRYAFEDGARVVYYTTAFRNVGIQVGAQPRRVEVSDDLAVQWSASLARMQVAIIAEVLQRAAAR